MTPGTKAITINRERMRLSHADVPRNLINTRAIVSKNPLYRRPSTQFTFCRDRNIQRIKRRMLRATQAGTR